MPRARVLPLLAVAVAVAAAAQGQPPPADVEAAQKRLTEYLKGLPGGVAGRVTALTADGVPETFPDFVLFSVIFPQFPVARAAPEPLGPSNVIAVPKQDGKPIPITDAKGLETFFKDRARNVTTAAEAEAAARAWLRATAELNQDGFYGFTVRDKVEVGERGGSLTASGAVAVDPAGGNKGGITAKLTFKNGRLVAADTNVSLSPGPRPVCQALKLLDPDPVVRRMAEDALRVMGSACKPYLDEQRAKAAPDLKAAIDAVWKRIVDEGR